MNDKLRELEKQVIQKYPQYELELTSVWRQLYDGSTLGAQQSRDHEIARLTKILKG